MKDNGGSRVGSWHDFDFNHAGSALSTPLFCAAQVLFSSYGFGIHQQGAVPTNQPKLDHQPAQIIGCDIIQPGVLPEMAVAELARSPHSQGN